MKKIYTKYKTLNTELIRNLNNHDLVYCKDLDYTQEDLIPFMFYKGRVYPSNINIMNNLQPNSIIIDAVSSIDDVNCTNCHQIISSTSLYTFYDVAKRSRSSKVQYLRFIFQRDPYRQHLPVVGKRLFIRKDEVSGILLPGNFPKRIWGALSLEWSNEKWMIMKVGTVPEINWDIDEHILKMETSNQTMIALLYLDWEKDFKKPAPSIFADAWENLLKTKQ
ncbi:hypothetical protein A8O28_04765 [Enterobacteriaceae bacterium CCUG 67584]|nr:hypothetical protein [Enterobacteriaceae bacterium CCUG 67584]